LSIWWSLVVVAVQPLLVAVAEPVASAQEQVFL
jgi:hypothetical protein